MVAPVTILVLWIAFAATHMGLSARSLRPRLVAALGERPFAGVYSLVALAIFVPLVWVYFANQHAGPHLWYLGGSGAVRWVAYVGMAVALSLVVGGLARPSPASIAAAREGEVQVEGVLRITRHPLFMGLGLFGLVHLLGANVNAAELAFFGGFPLFALIGSWHQDRRKLAAGESYRRFHGQTAFLPFARGGLVAAVGEAYVPIAIGVGITVLLRLVHPSLFGGAA